MSTHTKVEKFEGKTGTRRTVKAFAGGALKRQIVIHPEWYDLIADVLDPADSATGAQIESECGEYWDVQLDGDELIFLPHRQRTGAIRVAVAELR